VLEKPVDRDRLRSTLAEHSKLALSQSAA
jgi:hypothetical protein